MPRLRAGSSVAEQGTFNPRVVGEFGLSGFLCSFSPVRSLFPVTFPVSTCNSYRLSLWALPLPAWGAEAERISRRGAPTRWSLPSLHGSTRRSSFQWGNRTRSPPKVAGLAPSAPSIGAIRARDQASCAHGGMIAHARAESKHQRRAARSGPKVANLSREGGPS